MPRVYINCNPLSDIDSKQQVAGKRIFERTCKFDKIDREVSVVVEGISDAMFDSLTALVPTLGIRELRKENLERIIAEQAPEIAEMITNKFEEINDRMRRVLTGDTGNDGYLEFTAPVPNYTHTVVVKGGLQETELQVSEEMYKVPGTKGIFDTKSLADIIIPLKNNHPGVISALIRYHVIDMILAKQFTHKKAVHELKVAGIDEQTANDEVEAFITELLRNNIIQKLH